MPQFIPEITLLSNAESMAVASRQLLGFLRLPTEAGPFREAPSKAGFLISALPEGSVSTGPTPFNWNTTEIFDVDGRLLFRDQVLGLDGDSEIRVRTAASDLLRTPVWSIKSGPRLNLEGLVQKALSAMPQLPGGPVTPTVGPNKEVRIVCYSYPKLGLLCVRPDAPDTPLVLDIGDLSLVAVSSFKDHSDPESVVTVWSPYDIVVSTTIGQFRSLWERNVSALPDLPEGGEGGLEGAVHEARSRILEERTVNPELALSGQQTNVFCAVATAEMILRHHGIVKSQTEIAVAMATGSSGTTNPQQAAGYVALSSGRLQPTLDETASFEEGRTEIGQNRPFKSGVSGHARACGGYRVEESGKTWLYILDPWPPRVGQTYYEDWSAIYHTNYMYVRPSLFS